MTVTTAVAQREWDGFVEGCANGTIYHLWRWREVFERAFHHPTVHLAARQGSEVTGVLPLVRFDSAVFGRFLVSLPFVNYGGVLAKNDEAARALVEHARDLGRQSKASHIELRHVDPRFPDLQSKRHKVTMLLALPDDVEVLWQTIDKKVRNQIRKAQKSGLTVTAGSLEILGEFYDVFCRNMRDLGTPVYHRRFFEEILRRFPDSARVVVVRHGSRPVAAGLTLAHRGTLELPWASSLREYRPQCPNYLLYWSIMQEAIATGARMFDFGRSTPEDGPYQFKKAWGARAVPLCWEYQLMWSKALPDRSPHNPKFRAAIKVWQRLPLPVTNCFGPLVARYLP